MLHGFGSGTRTGEPFRTTRESAAAMPPVTAPATRHGCDRTTERGVVPARRQVVGRDRSSRTCDVRNDRRPSRSGSPTGGRTHFFARWNVGRARRTVPRGLTVATRFVVGLRSRAPLSVPRRRATRRAPPVRAIRPARDDPGPHP
jgi:hypothetical protein